MHLPWVAGSGIAEIALAFFAGESVVAAGSGAAREGHATAGGGAPALLDLDHRALRIDGEFVRLTPLEFGVMRRLTTRPGVVVTRDELLEHVWKQPFAGSNKVEAVVRTLRKKLGRHANLIETVIGHGYRFGDPPAEATH